MVELYSGADLPGWMRAALNKVQSRVSRYSIAYDHPDAHRTSNMVDRTLQFMKRHLFATRYFHGNLQAAESGIRGWSLIQNFAPSCPATRKKHDGKESSAVRLNGFRYSESWLENLLISASLQARYGPPQNSLQ